MLQVKAPSRHQPRVPLSRHPVRSSLSTPQQPQPPCPPQPPLPAASSSQQQTSLAYVDTRASHHDPRPVVPSPPLHHDSVSEPASLSQHDTRPGTSADPASSSLHSYGAHQRLVEMSPHKLGAEVLRLEGGQEECPATNPLPEASHAVQVRSKRGVYWVEHEGMGERMAQGHKG